MIGNALVGDLCLVAAGATIVLTREYQGEANTLSVSSDGSSLNTLDLNDVFLARTSDQKGPVQWAPFL